MNEQLADYLLTLTNLVILLQARFNVMSIKYGGLQEKTTNDQRPGGDPCRRTE
jgi:hypothetical protein